MSSPTEANRRYIEHVKVRDSNRESLFVFIALVCVISISALLLVLRHTPHTHSNKIPASLTNIVTQLSNAEVELLLLHDLGVIAETPLLDDLIREQLPPFVEYAFIEAAPGCFLLAQSPFYIRFSKNMTSQRNEGKQKWKISWLDESSDHWHEQVDVLGTSPEEACDEHLQWHTISALNIP